MIRHQSMSSIVTYCKITYRGHTLYQCSQDHSHSYMFHQHSHKHWISQHMFHYTGWNIFHRISPDDTLLVTKMPLNYFLCSSLCYQFENLDAVTNYVITYTQISIGVVMKICLTSFDLICMQSFFFFVFMVNMVRYHFLIEFTHVNDHKIGSYYPLYVLTNGTVNFWRLEKYIIVASC